MVCFHSRLYETSLIVKHHSVYKLTDSSGLSLPDVTSWVMSDCILPYLSRREMFRTWTVAAAIPSPVRLSLTTPLIPQWAAQINSNKDSLLSCHSPGRLSLYRDIHIYDFKLNFNIPRSWRVFVTSQLEGDLKIIRC